MLETAPLHARTITTSGSVAGRDDATAMDDPAWPSVEDLPPRTTPLSTVPTVVVIAVGAVARTTIVVITVIPVVVPPTSRLVLPSCEELLELATVEPDATTAFTSVERDSIAIDFVHGRASATWTEHMDLLLETEPYARGLEMKARKFRSIRWRNSKLVSPDGRVPHRPQGNEG